MNDEQKQIIKNEAYLWSLVYPHFKVTDEILATYSPTNNVTPNSNQIFSWQSGDLSTDDYSMVASEYKKIEQKGFYRQLLPTEKSWAEGYEYHMISNSKSVEAKTSRLSYKIDTDVSENKDFIRVFTEAFNLSEDNTKGFLNRMSGLVEKIKLKYVIGYFENQPYCVGGFYKSYDYWYLMNFGTSKENQGKGFGTDYLSTVTRFLDQPVVFRTVNKALVEGVGPKSGYKVAIKSKMLPLEDKIVI